MPTIDNSNMIHQMTYNDKEITPMSQNILFYTGVFFIVFGVFFITIVSSVIYSVIFNMPVVE